MWSNNRLPSAEQDRKGIWKLRVGLLHREEAKRRGLCRHNDERRKSQITSCSASESSTTMSPDFVHSAWRLRSEAEKSMGVSCSGGRLEVPYMTSSIWQLYQSCPAPERLVLQRSTPGLRPPCVVALRASSASAFARNGNLAISDCVRERAHLPC